MAVEAGQIYVEIDAKVDSFNRKVRQVDNELSKLKRTGAIAVAVDTRQLHSLNDLIDQKIDHLGELRKEAGKGIKPIFDSTSFSAGISQIRALRTELAGLKSDIVGSGSFSGTIRHQIEISGYSLSGDFRSVGKNVTDGLKEIRVAIESQKQGFLGMGISALFKGFFGGVGVSGGLRMGNGIQATLGLDFGDIGRRTGTDLNKKVKQLNEFLDFVAKDALNFRGGFTEATDLVKKNVDAIYNTVTSPKTYKGLEDMAVELARLEKGFDNPKAKEILTKGYEKTFAELNKVLEEDFARFVGASLKIVSQVPRFRKRVLLGDSARIVTENLETVSRQYDESLGPIQESSVQQVKNSSGIVLVVGGNQPQKSKHGQPNVDSTYLLADLIRGTQPTAYVKPVTPIIGNSLETLQNGPVQLLREVVLDNVDKVKDVLKNIMPEDEINSLFAQIGNKHPIERMMQVNLEGQDQDAIKLAQEALAVSKKFPDKKVNLVGGSFGGYVVEEAIAILNEIAYLYPELKDVVSRINGIALGSPLVGLTNTFDSRLDELDLFAAKYKAFIGGLDHIGAAIFGTQFIHGFNSSNPSEAKKANEVLQKAVFTMPNNALWPHPAQMVSKNWPASFDHAVGAMAVNLMGGTGETGKAYKQFLKDSDPVYVSLLKEISGLDVEIKQTESAITSLSIKMKEMQDVGDDTAFAELNQELQSVIKSYTDLSIRQKEFLSQKNALDSGMLGVGKISIGKGSKEATKVMGDVLTAYSTLLYGVKGVVPDSYSFLDPSLDPEKAKQIASAKPEDVNLPPGQSQLQMWKAKASNFFRKPELFGDVFGEFVKETEVLAQSFYDEYQKAYKRTGEVVAPIFQAITESSDIHDSNANYSTATYRKAGELDPELNQVSEPRTMDIMYRVAGITEHQTYAESLAAYKSRLKEIDSLPNKQFAEQIKKVVEAFLAIRKKDIALYQQYLGYVVEHQQKLLSGEFEPERPGWLLETIQNSAYGRIGGAIGMSNWFTQKQEDGSYRLNPERKTERKVLENIGASLGRPSTFPDEWANFIGKFVEGIVEFERSARQNISVLAPAIEAGQNLSTDLKMLAIELADSGQAVGILDKTIADRPFVLNSILRLNEELQSSGLPTVDPMSAKFLGQGFTGHVVSARMGESPVAIKHLTTDYNESKIGSEGELGALKALGEKGLSPSLVSYVPNKKTLITTVVDGQTLEQLRKSMSPELFNKAIIEMGKLMRAIHDMGYTHNDMSMANVMIDKSGRLVAIDLANADSIKSDTSEQQKEFDINRSLERTGINDEQYRALFMQGYKQQAGQPIISELAGGQLVDSGISVKLIDPVVENIKRQEKNVVTSIEDFYEEINDSIQRLRTVAKQSTNPVESNFVSSPNELSTTEKYLAMLYKELAAFHQDMMGGGGNPSDVTPPGTGEPGGQLVFATGPNPDDNSPAGVSPNNPPGGSGGGGLSVAPTLSAIGKNLAKNSVGAIDQFAEMIAPFTQSRIGKATMGVGSITLGAALTHSLGLDAIAGGFVENLINSGLDKADAQIVEAIRHHFDLLSQDTINFVVQAFKESFPTDYGPLPEPTGVTGKIGSFFHAIRNSADEKIIEFIQGLLTNAQSKLGSSLDSAINVGDFALKIPEDQIGAIGGDVAKFIVDIAVGKIAGDGLSGGFERLRGALGLEKESPLLQSALKYQQAKLGSGDIATSKKAYQDQLFALLNSDTYTDEGLHDLGMSLGMGTMMGMPTKPKKADKARLIAQNNDPDTVMEQMGILGNKIRREKDWLSDFDDQRATLTDREKDYWREIIDRGVSGKQERIANIKKPQNPFDINNGDDIYAAEQALTQMVAIARDLQLAEDRISNLWSKNQMTGDFRKYLGNKKQDIGIARNLLRAEMLSLSSYVADGFNPDFRKAKNVTAQQMEEAIAVIKKVWGISSPSRVMIGIAKDIVAGFDEGLNLDKIANRIPKEFSDIVNDLSQLKTTVDFSRVLGSDPVKDLADVIETNYGKKTESFYLSHRTRDFVLPSILKNGVLDSGSLYQRGLIDIPRIDEIKAFGGHVAYASPVVPGKSYQDQAHRFGPIEVIIDPSKVANKTTFTMYDTRGGEFIKDAPNPFSQFNIAEAQRLKSEYPEAQIKGGVALNEIAGLNFGNLEDLYSQKGQKIIDLINTSLAAGIPVFAKNADRLSKELGLNLSKSIKDVSEIGFYINKGLAAGINKSKDDPIRAIANTTHGIINTAKDILDEHSPSKVFIKIGENVALGYEIGIKDGIAQILDIKRLTLPTPDVEEVDGYKTIEKYKGDIEKLEKTKIQRLMDFDDRPNMDWFYQRANDLQKSKLFVGDQYGFGDDSATWLRHYQNQKQVSSVVPFTQEELMLFLGGAREQDTPKSADNLASIPEPTWSNEPPAPIPPIQHFYKPRSRQAVEDPWETNSVQPPIPPNWREQRGWKNGAYPNPWDEIQPPNVPQSRQRTDADRVLERVKAFESSLQKLGLSLSDVADLNKLAQRLKELGLTFDDLSLDVETLRNKLEKGLSQMGLNFADVANLGQQERDQLYATITPQKAPAEEVETQPIQPPGTNNHQAAMDEFKRQADMAGELVEKMRQERESWEIPYDPTGSGSGGSVPPTPPVPPAGASPDPERPNDSAPRVGKDRLLMTQYRNWQENRINGVERAIAEMPKDKNAIYKFFEWFNNILDEVEEGAGAAGAGIQGLGRIIGALEEKAPGIARIVDNIKGFAGGILMYMGFQQIEQVLVDFGRAGITTALEIERLKVALTFDPTINAASKIKEIAEAANEMGANALVAAQSFTKLTVAAANTAVAPQVKGIWQGFTQALTAQGATPEEQQRAFLAVQQMIGKGQIMAEELRSQLAEVMPQVTGALARSMGLTEEQLTIQMQTEKLLPQNDLLLLSRQLAMESIIPGSQVKDGVLGDIARFQNVTQKMQGNLGSSLLGIASGDIPFTDTSAFDIVNGSLNMVADNARVAITAIGALAALLAGKFLYALLDSGVGSRVLSIALKAVGLEAVTNNFILRAWNNTLGSVNRNLYISATAGNGFQRSIAGLTGVLSGALTILRAMALPVAIFTGIGIVFDVWSKHQEAVNNELVKTLKLQDEMIDKLILTGKLGSQVKATNEIDPASRRDQLFLNPGYSLNPLSGSQFILGGNGILNPARNFNLDRPYWGTRDTSITYYDKDGKPERVVKVTWDEKDLIEANRDAIAKSVVKTQSLINYAESNGAFASPENLKEAQQKIGDAQRRVRAVDTLLARNEYANDPSMFKELSLEKQKAVGDLADQIELYFKNSAAIESQVKALQGALEWNNLNEPDAQRKEQTRSKLEELIAAGNTILESVRKHTGDINQNIPGLGKQLELISAYSQNFAQYNEFVAGKRNNYAMSGRVFGQFRDVDLQEQQGQDAITTAARQFYANEFYLKENEKILNNFEPSIEKEALNRPLLTKPDGTPYANAMEMILNTSAETMDKVLNSAGVDSPLAKWLQTAINLKNQLNKYQELEGKILEATIAQQRLMEERMQSIRQANVEIAAMNTSIGIYRGATMGKLGTKDIETLTSYNELAKAKAQYDNALLMAKDKNKRPEEVQQQIKQAEEAVAKAEYAILQSNQGLEEYYLGLGRSIEDVNRSVAETQINWQQQIRDFQWTVEDSMRNAFLETRGLEEAWSDLQFELEGQLIAAQNEILNTNEKIRQANANLRVEQIGFQSEGFGKRAAGILSDFLSSIGNIETEGRSLEERQRQLGQEYVTTLRRIRDEQEKQLNAERERTRAMIRLNEQFRSLMMQMEQSSVQLGRTLADLLRRISIEAPGSGFNEFVPQLPERPQFISPAGIDPRISGPIAGYQPAYDYQSPVKQLPSGDNQKYGPGKQIDLGNVDSTNDDWKAAYWQQTLASPQTTQRLSPPTAKPKPQSKPKPVDMKRVRELILYYADILQVSPRELAALISFESAGTFSPDIMGGTGGNYQGWIQFSPENRKKYGVKQGQSLDHHAAQSYNYLHDRLKRNGDLSNPSLKSLYRAINPGFDYNELLRRLHKNGHWRNADRLLGLQSSMPQEWLMASGMSDMQQPMLLADLPQIDNPFTGNPLGRDISDALNTLGNWRKNLAPLFGGKPKKKWDIYEIMRNYVIENAPNGENIEGEIFNLAKRQGSYYENFVAYLKHKNQQTTFDPKVIDDYLNNGQISQVPQPPINNNKPNKSFIWESNNFEPKPSTPSWPSSKPTNDSDPLIVREREKAKSTISPAGTRKTTTVNLPKFGTPNLPTYENVEGLSQQINPNGINNIGSLGAVQAIQKAQEQYQPQKVNIFDNLTQFQDPYPVKVQDTTPFNMMAADIYNAKSQTIELTRKLQELQKQTELVKFDNSFKTLLQGIEDASRNLGYKLEDNAVKYRELAINAKGFKTALDEIGLAGEGVATQFRQMERDFNNELLSLARQTSDMTVGVSTMTDLIAAKEAELTKDGRQATADEQKMLDIWRQNIAVFNQTIPMLQSQTNLVRKQRDEAIALRDVTKQNVELYARLEKVMAGKQGYAKLAAELYKTRYDVGAQNDWGLGTIIDPSAVINARMQAAQAQYDLERLVEKGYYTAQQGAELQKFQSEISDLNIKRSFVEAIPGLKEFSSGLRSAILESKGLGESLTKVKDLVLGMLLEQLTIKPLQNAIAGWLAPMLGFNDQGMFTQKITRLGERGWGKVAANNIVPFDFSKTEATDQVLPESYDVADAFMKLADSTNNTSQVIEGTFLAGITATDPAMIGFIAGLTQATAALSAFTISLTAGSTNHFVDTGSKLFGNLFSQSNAKAGQSVVDSLGGGFTGVLNHVFNFAEGGSIADAMNRERAQSGRMPVLAVLNTDEYVIPAHEATDYLNYKDWSQRLSKDVKNFAKGGPVGYLPMISRNNTSEGSVNNFNQNIKIEVASTNDLGKSMTQIERDRQLAKLRAGVR